MAGFSLHAGVAARADQRPKLERLCRYISRPAISEKRLSVTPNGNVRYQLKTPCRDGTTHVIFEPLDFIARLAALVPKPRVNLTRFHGVFAPNSKYRARVIPARRGRGGQHARTADPEESTPAERRAAMSLKRNASSGCLGSTSRPARPAAVRCGSSPALRTPTSSRRYSLTWMRKWLSPTPRGVRPAGRRRRVGCSTRRGDNPRMTSFGLCRQRHGHGGGWSGNRRGGEKGAGAAVAGVNSAV